MGGGGGQGGTFVTPGTAGCPAKQPTEGSACSTVGSCQYPQPSVDLCMPQPVAYCTEGHWHISLQSLVTDCGWMLPPTICPATPPQANTPCNGPVSCNYPNTVSACPPYSTSTCINGLWSSGGPLIECFPPGAAGQGPGGGGEGPGYAGEGPGAGGDGGFAQGGVGGAP